MYLHKNVILNNKLRILNRLYVFVIKYKLIHKIFNNSFMKVTY